MIWFAVATSAVMMVVGVLLYWQSRTEQSAQLGPAVFLLGVIGGLLTLGTALL